MAGRQKKPTTAQTSSKPRASVFVIRGDEHERKKLTKVLTKAGFTVHSYFTVRELVLDQVHKTEGVVVADYRLMGSHGAELVEQLRAARIKLPVILFVSPADIPKATKLEVADFLVHPYDLQLLLEAIDRALNGTEYDSDELSRTFRRLTVREREILNAICIGNSSREIGQALDIVTKTVESHRARIMAKTRARDICELVRLYRAWNG